MDNCLRSESYGYPTIISMCRVVCLKCGHSYLSNSTMGCQSCKNKKKTCNCFPKYPMTEEQHDKYLKIQKRIMKMKITKDMRKEKKILVNIARRKNLEKAIKNS